jgi:polygalacturonase
MHFTRPAFFSFRKRGLSILLLLVGASAFTALRAAAPRLETFEVAAFGAKGDGKTLDTDAINHAIEAASAVGGGTVHFPAGRYLSFSIRLKSHIRLVLDAGCVLEAADPHQHGGQYDLPENNDWDMYQDFGHSHWQNSLIWGIGLEDVSITGPGLIHGNGLTKGGPGPRRASQAGDMPLVFSTGVTDPVEGTYKAANAPVSADGRPPIDPTMNGEGNKAIALKNCRNVVLRDFSVLLGGHFAVLASGVDNLTIDNVKVDTQRDGFDIDACRNVRIANCSVNSPNDDAYVFKSSYALGAPRFTENVSLINCQGTGFDVGTFLDGTFQKTQDIAPDHEGNCGRIKLGTESNVGFRNIAFGNCVFERTRGIALETVDGGLLEDVTINNVTLREVVNSPIFLRLGQRMRGPKGVPIGKLRRISISNVSAYDVDPKYAVVIAGLPGHPIEEVTLRGIRIHYRGGGTKEQAERVVPENENAYPEPSMFGVTPSYGFFIRHAVGVELGDIDVTFAENDHRPAFQLEDVRDADMVNIKAKKLEGGSTVRLKGVTGFTLRNSRDLPETRVDRATEKTF